MVQQNTQKLLVFVYDSNC